MTRSDVVNQDTDDFFHFGGKARFDKACHTLEGIMYGITADNKVNEEELKQLTVWLSANRKYSNRHPFKEIYSRLSKVQLNTVLNEEELAGVLWFSKQLSTREVFFEAFTSDMQRFQGMLAGIVADGEVKKEELYGLEEWLEDRQYLKTIWPYTEVETLIVKVLKDGKIDDDEHKLLLYFFSEFSGLTGDKAIDVGGLDAAVFSTLGICATQPEVTIKNKTVCFTGSHSKYPKTELESQVQKFGGTRLKSVTRELDYLVVGSKGNPCWAYECYGRKVEKAMENRKLGSKVMLVHEMDFDEAIQDLENP